MTTASIGFTVSLPPTGGMRRMYLCAYAVGDHDSISQFVAEAREAKVWSRADAETLLACIRHELPHAQLVELRDAQA